MKYSGSPHRERSPSYFRRSVRSHHDDGRCSSCRFRLLPKCRDEGGGIHARHVIVHQRRIYLHRLQRLQRRTSIVHVSTLCPSERSASLMKMMLEGESSTTRTHMDNSQTPKHAEAAATRKAGPIKRSCVILNDGIALTPSGKRSTKPTSGLASSSYAVSTAIRYRTLHTCAKFRFLRC